MVRFSGNSFWLRLSKALLALVIGLWALAVVYGNLADYGTNWVYVKEVMSMTTVENDPGVSWRAVSDPTLQHLAYGAIILGEFVCGATFVLAAVLMGRHLTGPVSTFKVAKAPVAIGLMAAILVWLFGFMVIAGEWFQMWRSPTYNAQQSAFMFYMTILLSAIYIFQDSDGSTSASEQ